MHYIVSRLNTQDGAASRIQTCDSLLRSQALCSPNYGGGWGRREELNLQPPRYECIAPPIELRRHDQRARSGVAGTDQTCDLWLRRPALCSLSYGDKRCDGQESNPRLAFHRRALYR
jgi:hypothetical protein